MPQPISALADWTPEQIALGRKWVQAWREAGDVLEAERRERLRQLDSYHAIELLCGDADYTQAPHAPAPKSGLIEQQRWFRRAAGRD